MENRKNTRKPLDLSNDDVPITQFSRGYASKIFKHVKKKDKVLKVIKNSKSYAVVISIDRYNKLKKNGVNIEMCIKYDK